MRGAWVEMFATMLYDADVDSLPVRGAWVEIIDVSLVELSAISRSPCGERGLKFRSVCTLSDGLQVAPRAGSVG